MSLEKIAYFTTKPLLKISTKTFGLIGRYLIVHKRIEDNQENTLVVWKKLQGNIMIDM